MVEKQLAKRPAEQVNIKCEDECRRKGSCEHASKRHREFLTGYKRFSILYRQGRVLHDRAMKEFGLSGQQMGYLKHIYKNPGISQEDLAKEVRIDKGAVAKAIKDMIEKDYIVREQNTDDRRAYRLYPTERAEEICRVGEEHLEEIEKMLTKGLTDEEMETFMLLLDKITKNITKMLEGDKQE